MKIIKNENFHLKVGIRKLTRIISLGKHFVIHNFSIGSVDIGQTNQNEFSNYSNLKVYDKNYVAWCG